MLAEVVVQRGIPWTDVVYLSAALVAAFGAIVAVPMYVFFLKDRQKVLLRTEVADEQRRREQLENRVSELTKERDTLRESLADERKRPNVDEIAQVLSGATTELANVVKGTTLILDKLGTMNGGMAHASDALKETNETTRLQTEAVKFLAATIQQRFKIIED